MNQQQYWRYILHNNWFAFMVNVGRRVQCVFLFIHLLQLMCFQDSVFHLFVFYAHLEVCSFTGSVRSIDPSLWTAIISPESHVELPRVCNLSHKLQSVTFLVNLNRHIDFGQNVHIASASHAHCAHHAAKCIIMPYNKSWKTEKKTALTITHPLLQFITL